MTGDELMLDAKQDVQQLLNQLPENVSFDDIQYHIYVCQKIRRGIEDVEAGKTISDEEFDKQMSQWLEP